MRRTEWMRVGGLGEFDALVKGRLVTMLFQPLVDLATGETVAFEALARPPDDSAYPDIDALLAEAYRRDRVAELDWACRAAAIDAVNKATLPPEVPLFLNVEPAALNAPTPADIAGPFTQAVQAHRLVVEVTERALAQDPAGLIDALARTRSASVGIALDDVGAEPASLAFMPLVAPDFIKLDLRLIQSRPTTEIARIVSTVQAESERTGATILAEGIESAQHVMIAQSMGATVAQGWWFARPGPLPDHISVPSVPLRQPTSQAPIARTPFAVTSRYRTPVPASRELLAATCRYLEDEVTSGTDGAILLSSFEIAANFTPHMRKRYEQLARSTVLTAALARDMPATPARGVRGAHLDAHDPLAHEWAVVVLGARTATALTARRTDNSAPDGPGHFEAITTHDRSLVIEAARSLLLRLPGQGD